MSKLTPMMQQYMDLKKRYDDCILFFRLGDFYEMFFEDAEIASRELEITLTQRGAGLAEKAPMAGVPHHVAEGYISKLVERGYKVAVCEQVEDPSEANGIVKRDVVRVVTPGTITDESILKDKTNNYLASIYFDSFGIGIAYVDNSTGELYTTNYYDDENEMLSFAINEISKIQPSEIICNREFFNNKKIINIIKNNINPYINVYENLEGFNWKDKLKNHFHQIVLDSMLDSKKIYSSLSVAKLIDYLEDTQKIALDHINDIYFYEANNYMILDYNTRVNLEIDETIISKDKKGSILGFLDETSTSMGGRLLKKWLEQPLINKEAINKRSSSVEYLVNNLDIKDEIRDNLKKVYDMERLASKVSTGKCNGRDLISLKNSISQLPKLKELLENTNHENILEINNKIDPLTDVFQLIDSSIMDNPPIAITEGGLIKEGFNQELDEIKNVSTGGKNWLSDLEAKERKNSGINNLRIGFNKILGYYFEITKANIPKAPEHFIRRQTLTNSERYFTEELKDMESKILGAEERLLDFEYRIFLEVREKIKEQVNRIQKTSKYVSMVDVLTSFAETAYKSNFIRPNINNDGYIHIKKGRHPVVEYNIDSNLFIPNDTFLDLDENMVQIITGPNMAGKSTYMRQVAVITLLAHIGSFVPADIADISITDRIFTRIGAADNLSQGQSTFMVEMNEVSNIVKSATNQSLIILDEVGRGTSTYDGLSIAWALVEHIAEKIGAKTMFATHYHELTQLEEQFDQIKNLTIVAEEKGEDIIFLRKVVEGSTNKSYGIQVARLAGIDNSIINRANEILYSVEKNNSTDLSKVKEEEVKQLDLNDYKKEYFLENISNIDVDNLTAREALNRLYELVNEAKDLRGD